MLSISGNFFSLNSLKNHAQQSQKLQLQQSPLLKSLQNDVVSFSGNVDKRERLKKQYNLSPDATMTDVKNYQHSMVKKYYGLDVMTTDQIANNSGMTSNKNATYNMLVDNIIRAKAMGINPSEYTPKKANVKEIAIKEQTLVESTGVSQKDITKLKERVDINDKNIVYMTLIAKELKLNVNDPKVEEKRKQLKEIADNETKEKLREYVANNPEDIVEKSLLDCHNIIDKNKASANFSPEDIAMKNRIVKQGNELYSKYEDLSNARLLGIKTSNEKPVSIDNIPSTDTISKKQKQIANKIWEEQNNLCDLIKSENLETIGKAEN